jgi:ABC-type polysaccharide/polyol phosphate export permease
VRKSSYFQGLPALAPASGLHHRARQAQSTMRRLSADIKEMFQEQREFRELLFVMTSRDLMLRYKQTIMGFGWAVFMPLLNTILFSVIFTRVARLDVGVAYPVFAYCGLLAWNLTASALRFSVMSGFP